MSYLAPPPAPAPVIVQKDIGGLVSDYKYYTEQYRREGREVRLHECRSACTLALSLPNVCVYPTSVLKFHSAYHRDTKQIDQSVSAELFSAYPPAVRERLGYLTRQYRSLSGKELISLGVRDCTAPQNEIMIARARQRAAETQLASAGAPGVNPVSSLVDGVKSLFSGGSQQPTAVMAPTITPAPILTASLAPELTPLPPPRPAEFTTEAIAPEAETTAVARTEPDAPLPPTRTASAAPPRLPAMIRGAVPILPPQFMAYASLR